MILRTSIPVSTTLRGRSLAVDVGRLLLVVLSWLLAPAPSASASSEAVPSRIVVRFSDKLDTCVDCLLAQKRRLADFTGTPSLDQRLAKLSIRSARPLFAAPNETRRAGGRPTASRRIAGARDRFPRRAARAPAGLSAPNLGQVYVMDLPSGANAEQAAAELAADPDVAYAEPDYISHLDFVPDDPFFSTNGSWGQPYPDLWGLQVAGAAAAWEESTGGGVTVAVVDGGVAPHADVAANLWENPGEVANGMDDDGNGYVDDLRGWDFFNNDNDPEDQFGHGTHVAGTIAAIGNNGTGIVGMAWRSRVMAVKGFGPGGSAPTSLLAQAIVYAAENGADVINCSFGGPGFTQVMTDAVLTARALGVIVVASAGNSGTLVGSTEPAGLPGVIAVSAMTPFDEVASFSNHGDQVSVAAPGVDVLSLLAPAPPLGPVVAGEYVRLSGTSMAAPHVAGLAALLLAAQPDLDAEEVRWHLELSADQLGYPGYEGEHWNPRLGYGRINAVNVFDQPPITSRIRPREIERHVFAGTPGSLTSIDISFTTHDPVAWTLSHPSWITAPTASGSGPGTIPLGFDLTGVLPGDSVSGAVTADSPTFEWTEPLRATIHSHRDLRDGGEIAIHEEAVEAFPTYAASLPVRVASNGQTAMAVWNQLPTGLRAAVIDASGAIVSSFSIGPYGDTAHYDVATDGNEFVVVYVDHAQDAWAIRFTRNVIARRYSATGQFIAEHLVDSDRYGAYQIALYPLIEFDGTNYIVGWQKRDIRTSGTLYRTWLYTRSLSPDGTVGRRRRVSTRYSQANGAVSDVTYGCHTSGECLYSWRQGTLRFVVPIVDGRLDQRRRQTLQPPVSVVFEGQDLIPVANGFVLVGVRFGTCDGAGAFGARNCDNDVRALRLGLDGAPLDVGGIDVDRRPDRIPWRSQVQGYFDGTSTWVAFNLPAPPGASNGGHIFVGRIGPDGTVLDAEHDGLLVSAVETGGTAVVTKVGGRTLVLWNDSRNDASAGVPFGSLYGQFLLDPAT
jgi:hypothetical protein